LATKQVIIRIVDLKVTSNGDFPWHQAVAWRWSGPQEQFPDGGPDLSAIGGIPGHFCAASSVGEARRWPT